MVKSLLFRWEDSQALSRFTLSLCFVDTSANHTPCHHCGFCDRPLNHPGARSSCYGKHSEPCIRFHQAMFMRLRAHTCAYCLSINEAHYKRHVDLVEQLRSIYESCGEDWAIAPSEPEDRGRSRNVDDQSPDSSGTDRSLTPEYTASSKRQRKDAKQLARAASRARVVTQDEVNYVDAIVHSAEGITSSDSEGPRNSEEIEEIERHLRYNAHVYNAQPNLRGLKSLAQFQDAEGIDFDAEMERILDVFRINELARRNLKNRGLQGRALKIFLALVHDFKKAVVEDIVLVKKDHLEIRMRRAGYLRYTNKTAYGIVEDRYTDKDWKTGEKLASNSSDSSDVRSFHEYHSVPEVRSQQIYPLPPGHGPDRRHLEHPHERVSGDDGLHGASIEPYRTPLLPVLPAPASTKQPKSIKVVATKPSGHEVEAYYAGARKNNARQQQTSAWQTIPYGYKPTTFTVKPAWATRLVARTTTVPQSDLSPAHSSTFELTDSEALAAEAEVDIVKIKAPAVQAPPIVVSSAHNEPDQFTVPVDESANAPALSQSAISHKKQAKKAREAKRKARRAAAQHAGIDTSLEEDIAEESSEDPHSALRVDLLDQLYTLNNMVQDLGSLPATVPSKDPPLRTSSVQSIDTATQATTQLGQLHLSDDTSALVEAPATQSTPSPLPVSCHRKHANWIRFTRNFIADQLTDPFFSTWQGCSHSSSCMFEGNDILDCPFHEPCCSCVDPLSDRCYIVYPGGEIFSSGPYNRLRGEKLLSLYEKEDITKGRLMLVDDDLVRYFMEDAKTPSLYRNPSLVPERLSMEYAGYADGHKSGTLLRQEHLFEYLWQKNKMTKHQITQQTLQDLQRLTFERKGAEYMCYCHDVIPADGVPNDVTMCAHRNCQQVYFHNSCIKMLGADKLTHWYCTTCAAEMKRLARQTLRGLGYTDIPGEKKDAITIDEKKLKNLLALREGAADQVRDHMKQYRRKVEGVKLMAYETA